MPVTNARVAFSALSLLALLPSLSLQDRAWPSFAFPDQYETAVNGPPGRSKWAENDDFSGPPGQNKWKGGGEGSDSNRGSPGGGRGPPGGSPPGLDGKRPPGWNKGDTESSIEGGNYPNNDRTTYKPSYNDRTTRRPLNNDRITTNWNKGDTESSFEGGNYPNNDRTTYRPSYNDRTTQRPLNNDRITSNRNKGDTESSFEGGNYPNNDRTTYRPPNNDRTTYRPSYNDRTTYRPSYNNRTTQRPLNNDRITTNWNKGDTESLFESGNYPNNDRTTKRPPNNGRTTYRPPNNDRTTKRPLNNDRTTQRPSYDYDRDGPRGPNDHVPDRNEYSQNQQCRDNEFRCENNECLPRNVRCDNIIDCRDASDEQSCMANRNGENESGCVLPEQPEGGRYELGDCGRRCNKRPGDTVPKNSILNYTCKSNYKLSGNTISVCVDNEWYQPPSCQKVCSPLNSTSVDISCSYQGETVSCSERIMPGTRATLACKSSYKLPLTNDPAYREITCLDDGLWDRRLFRCLPECGTSIARGNTLIVSGFQAKAGVFPWHIGIYAKKNTNEYQQICGGSLISNNLVVSAAHCFYDEAYNRLHDSSKYAVAAGKHYRDWNTRERYAQHLMVESIEAGSRYQGARGNFAEDIALLKLKTPFELTTIVKPVCIDWDNTYEREQLQVGHAGKVVGWGKDIKGESTKSLQEINMPFVPYDQCLSAVPASFRGFLTSDKFCAGHLNGSSVCDGDSGGGLCFEKDNVWYLRGIVSVSPENRGTCDYNSYVGFTYISHFRDWIREAFVSS